MIRCYLLAQDEGNIILEANCVFASMTEKMATVSGRVD
jgi:hypothetical protein